MTVDTELKMNDNELIAEFMGLERSKVIWDQGQHAYTMKFPSVFNKMIVPSEMLFDCSWDWLMPVVQKAFDTEFFDKFEEWKVLNDKIRDALLQIDILKVRDSLVEFSHWYNKQKS